MSSRELPLKLSALSPLSRGLAHQRQQLPYHEQRSTAASTLTGPANQLNYIQRQPSSVRGLCGPGFAAAGPPSAPPSQLPIPLPPQQQPPRGYIPPAQQYPVTRQLDVYPQPQAPGCHYAAGQPTGSTAAAMLPAYSAPPCLPMEPNPQLPQYTTAVRTPYPYYAFPAPPTAAPIQDLGVVPVPQPMQLGQGGEQPWAAEQVQQQQAPTAFTVTAERPLDEPSTSTQSGSCSNLTETFHSAGQPQQQTPPAPPTRTATPPPLTAAKAPAAAGPPPTPPTPLQPTTVEALRSNSPPYSAGHGVLTMPGAVTSTRTLSAPPPVPSYPTPSPSPTHQPYHVACAAEGFQPQQLPQYANRGGPTAPEQVQPPPPACPSLSPYPAEVPYPGAPPHTGGGTLTAATWPGCLPPFQPLQTPTYTMLQHECLVPQPQPQPQPPQQQPRQPALPGGSPPTPSPLPVPAVSYAADRQPPLMMTNLPGPSQETPLGPVNIIPAPYPGGVTGLPSYGPREWAAAPGGGPFGSSYYPAGPTAGASAYAPSAAGVPVPSSSLAPHHAQNSSISTSSSKPGGDAPMSLIAAKSLGGLAVVALQRSALAMGKFAGKLDKGVAKLREKEAKWERKREQKRRFRMGECGEAGEVEGVEDEE